MKKLKNDSDSLMSSLKTVVSDADASDASAIAQVADREVASVVEKPGKGRSERRKRMVARLTKQITDRELRLAKIRSLCPHVDATKQEVVCYGMECEGQMKYFAYFCPECGKSWQEWV